MGPVGEAGDDERAVPRRLDWLLGTAIGVRALYGVAMLPLIPLLIGPAPLLLTLLSGSMVAEVVLGARARVGEISWTAAVLAGVPVWVLTDWLYWAAGRRWGDRALLAMLRRRDPAQAERRAARIERLAHRLGPTGVVVAKLMPVPGPLLYAAAGTGGMRLPVFLALNALGTLLTAGVVVTLGYTLGRGAIDVVDAFEQYAVVGTLVLVALGTVVVVVRRRRRSR